MGITGDASLLYIFLTRSDVDCAGVALNPRGRSEYVKKGYTRHFCSASCTTTPFSKLWSRSARSLLQKRLRRSVSVRPQEANTVEKGVVVLRRATHPIFTHFKCWAGRSWDTKNRSLGSGFWYWQQCQAGTERDNTL